VTTPHEVALLRLVAQRLAGPPAPTGTAAVRTLTAVQGQDFPGALASVALRSPGRRTSDVEAALDAGEVVRSWPMRGTLHLTAAADLPWMLDLMGPRALAGLARRRAQLELTDADAELAREAVVAALEGGKRSRRSDLLEAIRKYGIATTGQRGYHLLWFLAQTGTLVLGPTDDGEQLFVLLDEWIPAPRRPEREEALGELARRFFCGHGPATVQDLARWSGLTLGDVRAGLAVAREQLETVQVDGVEHHLDPATPERLTTCREEARGVFMLPGFDEFVLGYADRGTILDAAFADRIVPGGNGVFRPTVVSDGRIVGTWQFAGRGAKRTAVATPFTAFADGLAEVFQQQAAAPPWTSAGDQPAEGGLPFSRAAPQGRPGSRDQSAPGTRRSAERRERRGPTTAPSPRR